MIRVCGKEIQVHGSFLRIGSLTADKHEFLDDPSQLLSGLRGAGTRIDLFTFLQSLPSRAPQYKYPMEWDNLAALPISTFNEWWTKQIDNKTRNMIRKAEKKGVELREVPFDDALVKGVSAIYNECRVRQGKPFTHFGKSIDVVRREAGTFPENSIFIGAFLGDDLIGFLKLFSEGKTHASIMHIVSMVRHRDKAPTNALIAQAVRSCSEREIPFLVYSNFRYAGKEEDSLSDFKRNNGFERIDLPRYYVPLTRAGLIGLRLGLHHRLVEHFPKPVLARVRELRNAWYNRRLGSEMKAS